MIELIIYHDKISCLRKKSIKTYNRKKIKLDIQFIKYTFKKYIKK